MLQHESGLSRALFAQNRSGGFFNGRTSAQTFSNSIVALSSSLCHRRFALCASQVAALQKLSLYSRAVI